MRDLFQKFAALGLVVIAILFVIRFFNISYPIEVTNLSRSAELSVVGEGKVDVVPDIAYVDFGVVVNNVATAEEAQTRLSERNNKVIESFKASGIAEADIKTSNYSIYPNYNFENNRNDITGYNANTTISVKVRETSKIGSLIQSGTAAGANQILGTRYEVESPEKYREEARDKAITNAKEQAEKLASSLGITLGKVVNVVESSPGSPVYPMFNREAVALDAAGGGTPNLSPGTQTITSVVTLYFDKR